MATAQQRVTNAAYVDPLGRPKLTLEEVVALRADLADERIKPEARTRIRQTLQLAQDREEVAFLNGAEPHSPVVFNLIKEVLKEDYVRQEAVARRADDARRAAAREERRALVAGRPGRFSALPGPVQVAMYAESLAVDARAGWRAYREALTLQAAGKPIPVPWPFETEMLTVGELRQLERQGLLDDEFVEEAERRGIREGALW